MDVGRALVLIVPLFAALLFSRALDVALELVAERAASLELAG